MSRQTALGYLFLAIGLGLIALATAPTVLGLRAHPPVHVDVPLALLGFGVALAVFGAWLLPESGAPAAVTGFVGVVGPYVPRIPGLSRVSDPKPAMPPAPLAPPPVSPPTPPDEP